jgi:hypothetical protein
MSTEFDVNGAGSSVAAELPAGNDDLLLLLISFLPDDY